MKNLFKNLMLVAVAAMAFTACTQENEQVNKVEKSTIFSFEATIADDDTRSGFAEKEEGATAYKSEWFGDETLKIFVTDDSSYNVETTADINAEGKFDLELTDAPENFFMTVVSPAESWVSKDTANVPAVQTPLANSVDPKAHLLKAQAVPVSNGVANIAMAHQTAYGKMTVNGVDFEIDHVVVEFKGTFYGYDKSCSYTINATNVENNTFWFATEPIDVAEFTVTAYDAEGSAVTKTVDVAAAGKTLSFQYGRVSTFSVSGLEAVQVPSVPAFTSAAWANSSKSDKFIRFYSDELGTLQLNFYNCNNEAWLDARTYGFANSGDIYPGGVYSYYVDAAGISRDVVSGSVTISIVDGEYYIEFNNLTDYDGSYSLTATYKGSISGLQLPDTREQLAAPQPTATADGNIITISWDAITGADEYYVFCYVGGLDAITTTETSVTIEAAYGTKYDFLIRAVANDSNPNYKSSEDYYFDVTTEKDPNVFAEYIASDLYWDANGYFVFVVDQYEIFRVKMNDADCPNHTTILEGEYTGIASSTVPAKSFSVYQKVVGGYSEGWSSTKNTSTMSVSYVDGEYVIIVNYIGAWGGSGEVGYKGVPTGWDVPVAGGSGDSGDDNTGDSGDDNTGDYTELGTEANPYTFASVAVNNFFLNFEGAENGASLQLDRQNSDVSPMVALGAPFYLNNTAIIYSGSGNLYTVGSTTYNYAQFAPYSTLHVTKANGVYTCNLKMSVDGGVTYTYYTFTGSIANQSY